MLSIRYKKKICKYDSPITTRWSRCISQNILYPEIIKELRSSGLYLSSSKICQHAVELYMFRYMYVEYMC